MPVSGAIGSKDSADGAGIRVRRVKLDALDVNGGVIDTNGRVNGVKLRAGCVKLYADWVKGHAAGLAIEPIAWCFEQIAQYDGVIGVIVWPDCAGLCMYCVGLYPIGVNHWAISAKAGLVDVGLGQICLEGFQKVWACASWMEAYHRAMRFVE